MDCDTSACTAADSHNLSQSGQSDSLHASGQKRASVTMDVDETLPPKSSQRIRTMDTTDPASVPSLLRREALSTPSLLHREAMSSQRLLVASGFTSPPPPLCRRMATQDALLLNDEADMMAFLDEWSLRK